MAVWEQDTDQLMETWTPDGGIRFGSFFSESLHWSGLFLSLISKTLSRRSPPGSHPRPRWLLGPLRRLPLSEPPHSSPVTAAAFPSGLGDGSQSGSLCSGRLFGRPGEQGACPPAQGLAVGVTRGRGGEHSGIDAWPHPPRNRCAEKCHCCRTKVWYYQPHATGKWIKMPLTQQIKLTVK